MNKNIVKRLAALLSVKSIVTLLLSGVFAYLAITGNTSQEFMTVYTVVIAFYFGTQTQKISDAVALLAPGENRHSGPGENRQFWPGENRQSLFTI